MIVVDSDWMIVTLEPLFKIFNPTWWV